MNPARFPYIPRIAQGGPLALMPMVPISLANAGQTFTVDALLDTGASVNVLPYSIGLQLGLEWGKLKPISSLTGTLANVAARGAVLMATVATFSPVRLGFAWAQTDSVPTLLGQMNFFLEFEVCVFRAQSAFEVRPK